MRANVRDIAAQAAINPALVIRYFGSKEQLFAEAVSSSFDLLHNFESVDRRNLGRGFVDLLFSEQRSDDMLAMMLRGAVDPAVHELVIRLAQERMLEPMAALLGGGHARRQASLVLSIVSGIWLYRFLLPMGPLSDVDEVTRTRVAALIQSIIDEE